MSTVVIAKASAKVLAALDGCDLGDETLRVIIESVDPATPVDPVVQKALSRQSHIIKTQEERYVLGIVLEPLKEMGMTDSQKDLYSAMEVRKAAHVFMEDYGTLGLQHQINVSGQVKLLENWITRVDQVIEGQPVKAGTWLMGIRVVDDGLWKRIKEGSLTGFSIGGFAQRTPVGVG